MDDAIIRTESLSRRFGECEVVRSLSLNVPRGSVYGFLGPNGAGKTTTIRMLLGLLRPTAGAISLFGEPAGRHSLRRVGALVEAPSIYPHLTGEENLRHACLLKRVDKNDIPRVLGIVRLSDAAPRLAGAYSLGMKQRLGLAQALLGRPDLVILDEPTNGLDPAGIREMRHLLRDMPAEHGVTVFLSSHLLGEVEQIAGRIGILAHGTLRFDGTPEELRARRRNGIRMGVDRPCEAARILARHGYQASTDDGALLLDGSGRETAAAANRILVEGGLAVYSIASEQASLESMFLELTEHV